MKSSLLFENLKFCCALFTLFFFIAPNVYKIPTVLGSSKEGPIRSAPAYSITGKLKSKLPQCVQFPGTISGFFEYLLEMSKTLFFQGPEVTMQS